MKKWRCKVCGYIWEGENAPEQCPQCKQPSSAFEEIKDEGEMTWAAEHIVGVAKDVDEEIKNGLRANFEGECSEVGMYLAMSRVAFREGYPEIGEYWLSLIHICWTAAYTADTAPVHSRLPRYSRKPYISTSS